MLSAFFAFGLNNYIYCYSSQFSAIKHWAYNSNATVHETKLDSQFRCDGSNGYIVWFDNVLQIRDTVNEDLFDSDYNFNMVELILLPFIGHPSRSYYVLSSKR